MKRISPQRGSQGHKVGRRTFMTQSAASSLLLSATLRDLAAQEPNAKSHAGSDTHLMVGAQIAPHSLFDEGIQHALDLLQ